MLGKLERLCEEGRGCPGVVDENPLNRVERGGGKGLEMIGMNGGELFGEE
ncbi:hypothetical protein [Salmonella enterica]